MDKEYIKMCDHPLIQDKWEPKEGDTYSILKEPDMIYIVQKYDIEALERAPQVDLKDPWNETVKLFGGQFRDHFREFTWLPRQEDIQGWMLGNYSVDEMLTGFFAWWESVQIRWDYTGSITKLWLHYYMLIEHYLTWMGEAWEE